MTTVPRALKLRAPGAFVGAMKQRVFRLLEGEQSRAGRIIGFALLNLILLNLAAVMALRDGGTVREQLVAALRLDCGCLTSIHDVVAASVISPSSTSLRYPPHRVRTHRGRGCVLSGNWT
jgi:hypothetical protein